MGEVRRVLGQAALSATTLTDVYTVPSTAQAVISSVIVCNRGATATTFRVSVAVGGEANANKQYLYYDVGLAANDSFTATVGMALGSRDVVRVYAGNSNCSATVFGVEVT